MFLIVGEFGMDMYALLYLKQITNNNLLYSTWNSAGCYVAAWIGGEFRENGYMYIYVLSPFAVHLKLYITLFLFLHNIVDWLYPNTK